MDIFKKSFLIGAVLVMMGCGLPDYDSIDAPDATDTDGDDYTLAFQTNSDAEDYVIAYKVYWENEDEIDDDQDEIDEDDVESGFDTLDDLDFIQMATVDTTSDGDYPDDNSDATVEQDNSGTVVTLTFDTDTGQLSVSGADNTSILYRRVQEFDTSGDNDDDDSISILDFLDNNYDYMYTSSYTTDGVTISETDSDGIDSDIYDIFTDDDRFIGSTYDVTNITIAVAVYGYYISASTLERIESIPVYLGTVDIGFIYWLP
ncbi:MAG: hypothetical protein PQJ59_10800 [Spirochaetales bacterium]|nr:hypothetical protein [Spirochaetales bacterium]